MRVRTWCECMHTCMCQRDRECAGWYMVDVRRCARATSYVRRRICAADTAAAVRDERLAAQVRACRACARWGAARARVA